MGADGRDTTMSRRVEMSPEEKIEAAQKLIDEARAEMAAKKRSWPEKIEAGMCFGGSDENIWERIEAGFACILGEETGCMTENAMHHWVYLGHARDLIKIADDAHEPGLTR